MNDGIKAQISAFVDGELPENEAEMLLRRMSQDAELRQQVADYLAIGRMIRGERNVPGVDRLRDRIAAEVNERPLPDEIDVIGRDIPRFVRPLAGVAIAATVALAAIFGLQQTLDVSDQPDVGAANSVADGNAAETIYTVPGASDDILLEYRLSHGTTWLDLGVRGVNARLVSLQSHGVLVDVDAADRLSDDSGDQAIDQSTNPSDLHTQ